ncbi:kynureninase [Vitreoscilla stercoraria]|uniref:Kynureninase n=1 Tax=Vitreoscilla stercoraria TaxID=61 RepID=A0ABY4E7V2_VITST|nr:kynureninase [Vitreoscilla stercoraria]UOO91825.1 kynureninase [Vitreoscilla stercoraria]
MLTLEYCRELDEKDVLAAMKSEFALPNNTIYLDGNSLGVRPHAALERVNHIVRQEWEQDLIGSWNTHGWWELPLHIGNKVAQLVGAKAGEVAVTDTTSSNLFKVLATALKIQQDDSKRKIILAEREAFPTDLYIIQGMTAWLERGYELRLIDGPQDLQDALSDEVVAVVLSHVNYRSGYLWPMQETTAQIHAHGALVIWDLCHSIGAVEIDLNGSDADFAIGCTYKYLNGGPGAPAMVWVPEKHVNQVGQPLSGWWGHAKPFDMATDYTPAQGIRRYLSGTQPITSLALVDCGVDVFLKTQMSQIRSKSLALTDLFIALVEQECGQHALTLVTPREQAIRGSHVSFRHEHGFAIIQALIERGVVGDYREPEVMRFGITPLYLSHEDIWDAVQHLKNILDTGSWDQAHFHRRGAVT